MLSANVVLVVEMEHLVAVRVKDAEHRRTPQLYHRTFRLGTYYTCSRAVNTGVILDTRVHGS